MFGFIKRSSILSVLPVSVPKRDRGTLANRMLCLVGFAVILASSASGQGPTPPSGSRQTSQPGAAIISAPTSDPFVISAPANPTQAQTGAPTPGVPSGNPADTFPFGTSAEPPTPTVVSPLPQPGLPSTEAELSPSPTPVPLKVTVNIDLAKQRAYLLRDGKVELESPVSSGRAEHLTPTGEFSVVEKDPNHKSNLYGNFVKISNGQVIKRNAQSSMPVPGGARFEGAPMKFFVRFEGAAGTHAGYLPGYPASHGCVRMPAAKAEAFFNAVQIGTRVSVFGQTPLRASDSKEKKSSKPAASPTSAPTPTPTPKRTWWPFGKHE